jgi:hypothetical protein
MASYLPYLSDHKAESESYSCFFALVFSYWNRNGTNFAAKIRLLMKP